MSFRLVLKDAGAKFPRRLKNELLEALSEVFETAEQAGRYLSMLPRFLRNEVKVVPVEDVRPKK